MDIFATYDRDASRLEDPQRFWEEVEDILSGSIGTDGPGGEASMSSANGAPSSELSLFARLTSFYALCEACYDAHLEQQYNSDYLLSRLIDSRLLSNAQPRECSSALVSLATSAKTLPSLYLIYETMIRYGAQHINVFGADPTTKLLIPRLIHQFWAARYAEDYMERENSAATTTQSASTSANGHNRERSADHGETTIPQDWHIKQVRLSSQTHGQRVNVEARDRQLHCKLRDRAVRLLYEICRSQKLDLSNLRVIDATFINHLFELVEASRNWHDDTYNYQLIKLIVALNEQFMVSALKEGDTSAKQAVSVEKSPASKKTAVQASNTVMTVLRTRLNASKTFGENVIFMLNRASSLDAEDICMQLLLLKLLYLLFTTKETSHYFYTNDLKVLVDIFIRELSDLSDEHESLQHTYLRVLHPLLTNTQLLTYPYKRTQIRKLLIGLTSHAQVREISPTTQRLVNRCLNAQWCVDLTQADGSSARNGPQMHNFSVQSIGGGQVKTVEAPAITDSEGISIPVEANMDAYQGAPKRDGTVAAIAAANDVDALGPESPLLQPHEAYEISGANQDGAREPRRTPSQKSTDGRRPRSMSGNPPTSPSIDLRENAMRNHAAMHLTTDASLEGADGASVGTDRSTIPRSLLIQRNRLDDRGAPSRTSGQLRTHSSIDVSKLGINDDNDEECAQWDAGSGSNSWHQSMARDELESSRHIDAVRLQSPVETNTMASMSSVLAAGAQQQTDAPVDEVDSAAAFSFKSSVDDAPTYVPKHGDGMSSLGKSAARRAPPAPPKNADTQKARSRIDRGVAKGVASGSDSTLSLSVESYDTTLLPPMSMRLDSGTESSSREASPMMIAQRIMRARSNSGAKATVAGSSSPTPSLRRRPPPPPGASVNTSSTSVLPDVPQQQQQQQQRKVPPPVDRSTKGSRLPAASSRQASRRGSQSSDAGAITEPGHPESHTSPASAALTEKREPALSPPTITETSTEADERGTVNEQQSQNHLLAQYMDHLHVSSSSPYGWS